MRRVLSAGALSLALFAFENRAHAGDAAAAEALFSQGRAASDKGDFETACGKFAESNRLDPAVGTVFNLADCEEHRGHLAAAWQYFREVAQQLAPNDDRLPLAKQRAAALEKRVPKLTVHLADQRPGTRVVRDGVELGAASLGTALPVEPGKHTVVVSAAATKDATFTIDLREGEDKTLEVTTGTASSQPNSGPVATPSGGGGNTTLGWVLVAAGGAGIATFAITGALTLHEKSKVNADCDASKHCSQAGLDAAHTGSHLGTASTIALVSGVALGGVGAYFLLSSKGSSGETALVPQVSPTAQTLSLIRTW